MRRLLALLLSLCLIFTLIPVSLAAGLEPELQEQSALDGAVQPLAAEDGFQEFGTLLWKIENKVLTISGSGKIPKSACPWLDSNCIPDTIEAIVVGDEVTEIPEFAFQNGRRLKSVTLGKKAYFTPYVMASFGMTQLNGCDALETITVAPGNPKHSSIDGVLYDNRITTLQHLPRCWSGTSLTVPSTVTTIGSCAFHGTANVKSVHFPATLKQISEDAFLACKSITDVYYEGSEEDWSKIVIGDSNEIITGAQMHYSVASYNVSYSANGGSGSMPNSTVTAGKQVTLPSCGFTPPDGKVFLAWELDGVRHAPGDTVAVPGDVVFTAVWEDKKEEVVTYTISFDTNGGTGSIPTISVVNGGTYGDLPVAQRDGYLFLGWYTSAEGGSRVREDTQVVLVGDRILYAHWAVDAHERLRYKFHNFVPGEVSLDLHMYVLGDNCLARTIYNVYRDQEGCCFGMSSSAGLLYHTQSDVSPDMFRPGAEIPYQLDREDRSEALGLTTEEFAEAMQIGWFGYGPISSACSSYNQVDALCAAVKDFQENKAGPVVIGMWPGRSDYGHAITACYLYEVSETESAIGVYDSNFPGRVCSVSLGRDAVTGRYTGEWSYEPLHWGNGNGKTGRISFIPYDSYARVWEDRSGGRAAADENNMNLLIVNSDDVTIKQNGVELADLQNGELKTNAENTYPVIPLGVIADESGTITSTPVRDVYGIWLPSGTYSVENNASGAGQFGAYMVNKQLAAHIETNASVVEFHVSDQEKIGSVSVQEEGKEYRITLSSSGSLSCLDQQPYVEVTLTGETKAGTLVFEQKGKDVSVKNADVANGTLKIQAGDNGPTTDLQIPEDAGSAGGTDLTLEEQVMISFDANGGSGTMESISTTKGDQTVLPRCGFTPPAGKEFDKWAVGSAEGEKAGSGSSRTFDRDTVLYATWKDVQGGTTSGGGAPELPGNNGDPVNDPDESPDRTWENPYSDIAEDAPYFDAVKRVTEAKLMSGVGDSCFAPEKTLSRAELAQLLYNWAGRPDEKETSSFKDVPSGAWYAEAVAWAETHGIVNGYGDGRFGPDDVVTREQMVTTLYRYLGASASGQGLGKFSDHAAVSPYAVDAISWAVGLGVVFSNSSSTLEPLGAVTRAQAAQGLAALLSEKGK